MLYSNFSSKGNCPWWTLPPSPPVCRTHSSMVAADVTWEYDWINTLSNRWQYWTRGSDRNNITDYYHFNDCLIFITFLSWYGCLEANPTINVPLEELPVGKEKVFKLTYNSLRTSSTSPNPSWVGHVLKQIHINSCHYYSEVTDHQASQLRCDHRYQPWLL